MVKKKKKVVKNHQTHQLFQSDECKKQFVPGAQPFEQMKEDAPNGPSQIMMKKRTQEQEPLDDTVQVGEFNQGINKDKDVITDVFAQYQGGISPQKGAYPPVAAVANPQNPNRIALDSDDDADPSDVFDNIL